MKIGIIGCGHMGSALVEALITQRIGTIWVSNPKKPHLSPHSHVHWTVDNAEVVKKTDIIILAVKPAIVAGVLHEIKRFLRKHHILISIAAGIPQKSLSRWTKGHKKIVRVMPNLPAQVFEGISVWKASPGVTKREKHMVKNLLSSFGKHIEVKNEDLINVAVGGSGPAYTAAFLESMARSARQTGFTKSQARLLALQAVRGSLCYIEKTGSDFSALVRAVQTKGGITEASFRVLKRGKWQKIFEKALSAAYKKAVALSKGN